MVVRFSIDGCKEQKFVWWMQFFPFISKKAKTVFFFPYWSLERCSHGNKCVITNSLKDGIFIARLSEVIRKM